MGSTATTLASPMDDDLTDLSDCTPAEAIRSWGTDRAVVDERITPGWMNSLGDGRRPRTRAQHRADALITAERADETDCPRGYLGHHAARDTRTPGLVESFGTVDTEPARKIARTPGTGLEPIPETCPADHDPGRDVGQLRR